ncbi:MAG: Mur ligase family protein [Chloroflexota bacterium]|nr:Mur ligase family protein [Chloroflexota bacterium]MDE2947876.1 Mur ligase family protein [Chloroflexota bacterium]
MTFDSIDEAIDSIFATRRRLDGAPRGLDEYTRDISLTRSLLGRARLLDAEREYVVVTGSRGKGSVTTIMAKLLRSLGHTVGAITSPHLVHWNERIRVNGRMIPSEDFLRILRELRPRIDQITAEMSAAQYLSPQGIFLAIALRHFDEQGVNIAVLEVGRGGRFDDVAVVPNKLAVFTPIMLEHTALLGASLGRIAWHKAGIIKAGGDALTLPQAGTVIDALAAEAREQGARFTTLTETELAARVADRPGGQVIQLQPYGELFLPLLGRYQIANTTLAIRAVENLQRRLDGARPETPAFIDAIRRGLSEVSWPGRAQRLAGKPAAFVDGAITVKSAESFVASVRDRAREPVAAIVGVPRDRDYAGVYRVMAAVSQSLIITETDVNPSTRFPAREAAMVAAGETAAAVYYAKDLTGALSIAREQTGERGTILLAGSLMLVGECMLIWGVDTSAI